MAVTLLLCLTGCGGVETSSAPEEGVFTSVGDSLGVPPEEPIDVGAAVEQAEVIETPEPEAAADSPAVAAAPSAPGPSALPPINGSSPSTATEERDSEDSVARTVPGSRASAPFKTADKEAGTSIVREKIYYGTDRAPETTGSERWALYVTAVRRFQVLLILGLTLFGVSFYVSQRRVLIIVASALSLLACAWFGRGAMLEYQQAARDDRSQNRRYRNHIHVVDGRHTLERGYCWVSIPTKVHERGSGQLEEPGLFELQASADRHFILERVERTERSAFVRNLRNDVQASDSKHAFVFIHGYNVMFREAALRTAQMRYDLDFDGPAAFFSWPSNGSLLSYAADEETANLKVRFGVLHEFLMDFIDETGAESIHLIAHSMGNRLLTRAFEKLPDRKNSQGQQMINRLIMAAPDVNPAEFMLLADRIRNLTRSRTLYASDKDIALIGSETLRMSNYTRLGQGGAARIIVDGVQTIDASGLGRSLFDLGHSYYVHPRVMQDLKHLLTQQDITLTRPWLTAVENYWTFREQ